MHAGDAFVLDAPYAGGTHLPDVTVVMPCTCKRFPARRLHSHRRSSSQPGATTLTSKAARLDHAAHSTHIEEQGVLIDDVQLCERGSFAKASCTHY